jgi:hypothetical protein
MKHEGYLPCLQEHSLSRVRWSQTPHTQFFQHQLPRYPPTYSQAGDRSVSSPQVVRLQLCVMCCITRQIHPSWFDRPNNTGSVYVCSARDRVRGVGVQCGPVIERGNSVGAGLAGPWNCESTDTDQRIRENKNIRLKCVYYNAAVRFILTQCGTQTVNECHFIAVVSAAEIFCLFMSYCCAPSM